MRSKAIELDDGRLVGEWRYDQPRKQLVVICHGFNDSRENPTIVALTRGLNKHGYSTFTFNFSENAGGFDVEHQVKDIAQIADYFQEYRQIILLAGSFAALPAAIATIKLPAIRGLITLNGFFGEDQLGKDHHRNYLKFRIAALVLPKYRRILRYFKRGLRPELITAPVLVVHSKVDAYVLIEQSRNFYAQLTSPRQFVELQTANHGLTSPTDRRTVVAEIAKWLAKINHAAGP
jgi:uncharacterized protein